MIGRKAERQVINDCLSSKNAEFLVVYGRRRVGKTFMIKEFFNNAFSFYSTGVINLKKKEQLKIFNNALVEYGSTEGGIPSDWFEAFSRLKKILESKETYHEPSCHKLIVFLDEISWMDGPRSEFKSALDYFWNSYASTKKDLLFIICGSATSWIISNVVDDTGGLYRRVTKQIHLLPFTLKECEELLLNNGHSINRKKIIECYMAFGGIPYYLNYLNPRLSIDQNIDNLFFKENAPLQNEFYLLFSSLFNKSTNYIKIIETIASTRQGILRNELLKTIDSIEGKELTKCLIELEQCGFIRKYHNTLMKKNDAIYQLIDPFTQFYFAFKDSKESWLDLINTPKYNAWTGLGYEKVCLYHIKQIKFALGIQGIATSEYAFRSKKVKDGCQIDLLIDRKDDVINVCEIKYVKDEYTIDNSYYKQLVKKMEVFKEESRTKKALHLTMITTYGLKKNEYEQMVNEVLTEDDLFN